MVLDSTSESLHRSTTICFLSGCSSSFLGVLNSRFTFFLTTISLVGLSDLNICFLLTLWSPKASKFRGNYFFVVTSSYEITPGDWNIKNLVSYRGYALFKSRGLQRWPKHNSCPLTYSLVQVSETQCVEVAGLLIILCKPRSAETWDLPPKQCCSLQVMDPWVRRTIHGPQATSKQMNGIFISAHLMQ